jgi:hypothetical protein
VTGSPASQPNLLHSTSKFSPSSLISAATTTIASSPTDSLESLDDHRIRLGKAFPHEIVYPPTPPLMSGDNGEDPFISPIRSASTGSAGPQAIPYKIRDEYHARMIETPPLTPDDASIVGSGATKSSSASTKSSRKDGAKDALDFLLMLFPQDGLAALPYARSVIVSAPSATTVTFDGVVLELPGKPRVLYVDGKHAESVSLRERYARFSCFYYTVT